MLELSKVDQVVGQAASAALQGVSRVFSSPTIDSGGHEALSVTIVLKGGTEVTGESLGAIVKIGQGLSKSGEERLPIVEFATEEELAAGGDTES